MTEKLIELVKDYEYLYNVDCTNYKDQSMRNSAWDEIGEKLEIPANECKEMWSKLRNSYASAIKRRRKDNDQVDETIPPWRYDKQMMFLLPHMEMRAATRNSTPTIRNLRRIRKKRRKLSSDVFTTWGSAASRDVSVKTKKEVINKTKEDVKCNVKFVELIEGKPCLYDTSRADYFNRTVQDAAWNEIATEMKKTAHYCRERWKNIRGRYTRYLQKVSQAGSAASSIKRYYLADNLTFLQPFTKFRHMHHSEDTMDVNAEDDTDSSSNSTSVIDDNDTCHDKDRVSSDSIFANGTNNQSATKKLKKSSPSLQFSNKFLTNPQPTNNVKCDKNIDSETNDPDLSFLKSLLPDMRSMSDNQKRKFKIGILSLADQVLNDSDIARSQTFSSSMNNITVTSVNSLASFDDVERNNQVQISTPYSIT